MSDLVELLNDLNQGNKIDYGDYSQLMFCVEQLEKEKQTIIDTQTCQIESRDVYLAEKESIIIRQQNEIQKLEKEISVLLSCSDCSENKGGYVCEKEYNDKCLAQKIEHIKELNEENSKLKKQNAELKEILSFEEYREQFQKGERKLLGKTIKEWLIYQNENERLIEQVEDWKADHEHNLELMKGLNGKIAELKAEIKKLRKGFLTYHEVDFIRNMLTNLMNGWNTLNSIKEEAKTFYDRLYEVNACEYLEEEDDVTPSSK